MVSATVRYAQRQQQRINFSFGDILPGSFEGVVESLNLEGDVLFSLLDYAFWKLWLGKGLTAACCFSMYMSEIFVTFECARNGMVCIVCVWT